MVSILQKIWRRMFPVSEERAIKIAMVAYRKNRQFDEQSFRICKVRPNIYLQSQDPCWYIFVPWGDGLDGSILRSSRVIVISKVTGAILYDGSANDEG